MSTKLGNKLAASVRGAKQMNDSKDSAVPPNMVRADDKKEKKVITSSRRVGPD